ncbi:hypothetical protein VP1G_01878 [Cytospora mali]|uniref:Apple domain-containing protein n=1 Tax=Cytospora mali TaxID=578113 RepID=A0A194USA4_CYTMA|nr:hypothetical protein VP1G_01878 [Valsa mali var. pyri (nom. inval.)]
MRHIVWAASALPALFWGAATLPSPAGVDVVPNACTSDMPMGLGPSIVPDTASAFLAYGPFATNAAASTSVTGYNLVASNQQAFAETSPVTSLGWLNMASYNASTCGTYCTNTAGCQSFDIFYQRSPTVAPSFNTSCPNPSSMTSIMCWVYTTTMTTADLVNTGETRGQFQVVIADAPAS